MRLVHPASTSFCFSYMLFKFRKLKEFISGVKGVKELSLPMVAEELRQ